MKKCCGGKCKTVAVDLDVVAADQELIEAIASENEKEDPNGADEIIRLYTENIWYVG